MKNSPTISSFNIPHPLFVFERFHPLAWTIGGFGGSKGFLIENCMTCPGR